MTSLFQMLWDVTAGGGGDSRMKDALGGKWGCGVAGGISVPDLMVKFTEVSLVKFSLMKAFILLSQSHSPRIHPIDSQFHYQKIIDLKGSNLFFKEGIKFYFLRRIMLPQSHFYLLCIISKVSFLRRSFCIWEICKIFTCQN